MSLPRCLARALAGLAVALATATAALAAPPFWAVKDADSTIYLFGTMHVLTPETEWRTPAFDKALADSAQVWFEVDLAVDPKVLRGLVTRYGFDTEVPLEDKVSPETMTALRERLKASPGGANSADYMQPWTAGLVVQVLPMLAGGFKPEAGADKVLAGEAAGRQQTVRYFETLEQQVRFFADLPQPVQVQFLEDSLESEDEDGEAVLQMQEAWVAGDLDTFGPMIVGVMRDQRPELYEALIRGRNLVWVDVLATEMAGSGTAMVNVGALHMVGDDGLVALLRARGFTVERVQ